MRTGSVTTGPVDLLEVLARAASVDLVGQAQALEHPLPHRQLALAPVEQQELGRVGEASGPAGASCRRRVRGPVARRPAVGQLPRSATRAVRRRVSTSSMAA